MQHTQFTVPSKAEKDKKSFSSHFEWHLKVFNHEKLTVQTSLVPNNAKQALVLETILAKSISRLDYFFWHQNSLKNKLNEYEGVHCCLLSYQYQSRRFVASMKEIVASIILFWIMLKYCWNHGFQMESFLFISIPEIVSWWKRSVCNRSYCWQCRERCLLSPPLLPMPSNWSQEASTINLQKMIPNEVFNGGEEIKGSKVSKWHIKA